MTSPLRVAVNSVARSTAASCDAASNRMNRGSAVRATTYAPCYGIRTPPRPKGLRERRRSCRRRSSTSWKTTGKIARSAHSDKAKLTHLGPRARHCPHSTDRFLAELRYDECGVVPQPDNVDGRCVFPNDGNCSTVRTGDHVFAAACYSISSKAKAECAYAAPARISAATQMASISSSSVAPCRSAAFV